jgi:hypothetical protein
MKAASSRQNKRQSQVPAATAVANTMQRRFAEPTQCVYWHHPELVHAAPMKEGFELIDTYAAIGSPILTSIGRRPSRAVTTIR